MVDIYELIEHTADIGIRVKAKDLKDLFRNAGLAIFQISAEKKKIKQIKPHNLTIIQKADNLEELFINWLNELLSLSSSKGLIFEEILIKKINEK
jgi:SHS2 domain-containing protein